MSEGIRKWLMGLDKGKNDKKCFNKHMLFCEFSRCLEALKRLSDNRMDNDACVANA